MTFYIIFLILPPILFAAANLIDKHLVSGSGEDSKPGALIAIMGTSNMIISVLVLTYACLLQGNPLFCSQAVPLMLNGGTYVLAIYLYLRIAQTEEMSTIVPWMQLIPAFGLVGGMVILGEAPTLLQYVAIGVIIVSGVMIGAGSGVARFKIATTMIPVAALLAINDTVFARYGREMHDEATALGYDMAGKALWSLIPLLNMSSRKGYMLAMRTRFKMQFGSVLIEISADAMLDLAKIAFPIVVVQAVCATQPAFVLIGAVVLTIWLPNVLREEIGRNHLTRKIVATVLAVAGGIVLAQSV